MHLKGIMWGIKWPSYSTYHSAFHVHVVLVAQLYLTLCDPMDWSLPGSFVHGDSQGRNIGVGCHFFLQGIPPRNRTWVFCPTGRSLAVWTTRETHSQWSINISYNNEYDVYQVKLLYGAKKTTSSDGLHSSSLHPVMPSHTLSSHHVRPPPAGKVGSRVFPMVGVALCHVSSAALVLQTLPKVIEQLNNSTA